MGSESSCTLSLFPSLSVHTLRESKTFIYLYFHSVVSKRGSLEDIDNFLNYIKPKAYKYCKSKSQSFALI